jgi:hypothetical protein
MGKSHAVVAQKGRERNKDWSLARTVLLPASYLGVLATFRTEAGNLSFPFFLSTPANRSFALLDAWFSVSHC